MAYEFTSRIWAIGEDQNLASLCLAEEVEAKVRINMILRRANPAIKTLEQAHADGFRYRDESRQVCMRGDGCHATEANWMDWPSALAHGSADCKTFVAEEVAELRLKGIDARPLMRCFRCEPAGLCPLCHLVMKGNKQTWHVQTAIVTGGVTKVSDPSRWFGMAPHPDGDNVVIAPKHQAGLVQRDW